jgi:lipoprotein-anchoring transpeptidase ErfK/SrfK
MMLIPIKVIADAYPIPENGSRLIGSQLIYKVKQGDYFHSIAQSFNIGFVALIEANPDVDPFLPIPGTNLQIPSQMLLPEVPYQGIVVNLPELRLYYFTPESNEVYVFPIGIGRIERPTPVMKTYIKMKIKNPNWTPNARMRAEYLAENGKELPAVVQSGKDNPLGDYAMQLAYGNNDYLIHGTNSNFGIGLRVSSGCIRMNPDDIAWLFNKVKKYEKVRVINQPIKVSVEPNGENILEVHAPLSEVEDEAKYNFSWLNELIKLTDLDEVGNDEITKVLLLQQGLPINLDSVNKELN